MAEEDESWHVAVTADTNNASKAFDELLGIINGAADKAGDALGRFDAMMSRNGGTLLQMVASMHPLGRTVQGIIEVLDVAASAGARLATQLGTRNEFDRFIAALGDLKAAAVDVFAFFASQDGVIHSAIAGLPTAVGDAIRRLTELATLAIREFQVAMQAAIPDDKLSDQALEARLDRARASLRSALLDFNRSPQPTPEMNANIDRLEEQVNRLEGLQSARARLRFQPLDSAELEAGIAALRRQNQALEAEAEAHGLSAGAAARHRRELELMRAAREAGPGGLQRAEELRAELEAFERLTQAAADRAAATRSAARERGIFAGAEGRLAQAEAEAQAIGRTAGAVARLRIETQLLQQLQRAGIPVTEQHREAIAKIGEATEQATERTAELRRRMSEIEATGAIFSRTIEKAFSDWFSGTETNWRQLVNAMLRDIAMLTLRLHVLQPLFGGGGTQGGGWFGQLVSGLFGGGSTFTGPGGWTTTTVPALADGGPMTAGRPYLVGEMGPELVIPRHDSTVVPNHALGGGSTTINMRVDLAGANGDEAIARIAGAAARQAAAQAVEASNEAFPARRRRLQVQGI